MKHSEEAGKQALWDLAVLKGHVPSRQVWDTKTDETKRVGCSVCHNFLWDKFEDGIVLSAVYTYRGCKDVGYYKTAQQRVMTLEALVVEFRQNYEGAWRVAYESF